METHAVDGCEAPEAFGDVGDFDLLGVHRGASVFDSWGGLSIVAEGFGL